MITKLLAYTFQGGTVKLYVPGEGDPYIIVNEPCGAQLANIPLGASTRRTIVAALNALERQSAEGQTAVINALIFGS